MLAVGFGPSTRRRAAPRQRIADRFQWRAWRNVFLSKRTDTCRAAVEFERHRGPFVDSFATHLQLVLCTRKNVSYKEQNEKVIYRVLFYDFGLGG
jgi:hypothetical protein